MNTITINNKTYHVSGNNINVINDKVYVDGKLVEEGLSGNVHIKFEGDLASLDCNTCDISGNVTGNVKSNTISCNDVGGDIKANTVSCSNVQGKIKANVVNKA